MTRGVAQEIAGPVRARVSPVSSRDLGWAGLV